LLRTRRGRRVSPSAGIALPPSRPVPPHGKSLPQMIKLKAALRIRPAGQQQERWLTATVTATAGAANGCESDDPQALRPWAEYSCQARDSSHLCTNR
jgi:hypothetical protein